MMETAVPLLQSPQQHRTLWLLLLILSSGSVAMAVDRSKFRTCHQTSFCRRHRDGHSKRLYQYELLPETVHFHPALPHDDTAAHKEGDTQQQPDGEDKHKSVWSSLSQRFLGGKKDGRGDGSNEKDPHVRGTHPTLTGTIINTATETSSGTSEKLQFSLYAMANGLARLRITEVYGTPGSAHETPRITYDDLVLDDTQHWKEASEARWIKSSSNNNNAQDTALLKQLVGLTTQEKDDDTAISNFMALQFGDDASSTEGGSILLWRLKPFSLWLFRGGEEGLKAGPIVVLNAESLMSFEVRRFQNQQDGQEPKDDEKDETKQEEEEEDGEKPEKEIVGYWEDGLAIYSDGTREEKKKEEEDDHRKLSEEEMHELDRQGLWEEKFSSHTDSKPYGPMSVGMDIGFPQSQHLYGLPEHASSAVLQTTFSSQEGKDSHYQEPYRLYNLDVFEYELDETMALYGEVPLIVSQSTTTGTSGVFWFNPTETFVDVMQEEGSEATATTTTTTHWMSESGVVDIFFLTGPDPPSLYRQYAQLTGTAPVPPMFSLGYHQCRWNYKDEKDVYHVHGKFEELDYPYDVLWLDIEHTDGKRYFTWDDKLFPNPAQMQDKLWSQGRRMVTIIDPHIKRDDNYHIHKEATNKGLYIKDKDGKKDYDGWCWPGSSSYLDFTQEHVRKWWAEQFSFTKYRGSTPSLFTWNDMNEPSVFNGPEVSMQKDLRNLKGHEHREWHNLYGMLFQRATAEGQILRSEGQNVRPFVLTRAFFAGSQKYGAIWTGDNTAEWGHLQVTAPMLLSMNTAALSFVGADVGGFFGNPDAELMVRWMQSGAYQPFFRGHAHHDAKRREPWMFDEVSLDRCRRAAMERYALLPMWYSLFDEAQTTGMPVMRMMWMEYPHIESLFSVDHQYLIGSDLLVHPVTESGVTEVEVLFPSKDIWYDANSLELVAAEMADDRAVLSKQVPADMDTIPVFQRGGSILPRKLRLRRSSQMMKTDPYTLYVALDREHKATGHLYMDDEETFAHQTKSDYARASFEYASSKMTNSVEKGSGWHSPADTRMIERIVIVGYPKKPVSVSVQGVGPLDFEYESKSKLLVVRKPAISASEDWTLNFS